MSLTEFREWDWIAKAVPFLLYDKGYDSCQYPYPYSQ